MIKLLKLYIVLSGYKQIQCIDVGTDDNPISISRLWHAHRGAFTWMGLLMTKDYVPPEHLLSSSTLIVLINDGLAIGLAKDIVDLDPETTEVMFWLADGTTWNTDVDKYEVHPDHYAGKESLALVFLIPPTQFFDIQGLPINWTRSDIVPSPATIVGLDQDLTGIIRQTQKQVVTCDRNHCDTFYMSRASRPALYTSTMSRYSCYLEHLVNNSFCEYRSGMPLVFMTRSGHFSLFAIGVGGPGCSSCSRWLHFHPHREWVQRVSGPHLRSSRDDIGMYNYYEDLDQQLLAKMFKEDERQELEWKWRYTEQTIEGSCWQKRGPLVYREQMHFVSRQDATYGSYALSIYDLIYNHYTCVMLWATSNRSRTRWYASRGFKQDDIDYYVKKVPVTVDGSISPMIVFLTDKYMKYHDENIRVHHLEFEFRFDQETELEINFYGR